MHFGAASSRKYKFPCKLCEICWGVKIHFNFYFILYFSCYCSSFSLSTVSISPWHIRQHKARCKWQRETKFDTRLGWIAPWIVDSLAVPRALSPNKELLMFYAEPRKELALCSERFTCILAQLPPGVRSEKQRPKSVLGHRSMYLASCPHFLRPTTGCVINYCVASSSC